MDSTAILLTITTGLVFGSWMMLKEQHHDLLLNKAEPSEMFGAGNHPLDRGLDAEAGDQAIRFLELFKRHEPSGSLIMEAGQDRVTQGGPKTYIPDLLDKVMIQVPVPVSVLLTVLLVFVGLERCFAKLGDAWKTRHAKGKGDGNQGMEGTKRGPEEDGFDKDDEDDEICAEDDGKGGKRKKPQKKWKKIQIPKHPKKKDRGQT